MRKLKYILIGLIAILFFTGCSSKSNSLAGQYNTSVESTNVNGDNGPVTLYQQLYISDDETTMELEVSWLEYSYRNGKNMIYSETYTFELQDGKFSDPTKPTKGTVKIKNEELILNSPEWSERHRDVVENGTFSKKGSNDYSKTERDFEKISKKADN